MLVLPDEAIQTGEDFRTTGEIMDMIEGSAKFISGVVSPGRTHAPERRAPRTGRPG